MNAKISRYVFWPLWFVVVPLVLCTRRRSRMCVLANRRPTILVAAAVAALIVALNVFLLGQTLL